MNGAVTLARKKSSKQPAHPVEEGTFWQDSATGLRFKIIGFKVDRKVKFARLYPVAADGQEIVDATPALEPVDTFNDRMTWLDIKVEEEPALSMYHVEHSALLEAAKDVEKSDEALAAEFGTTSSNVRLILEREGSEKLLANRQEARRRQRAEFARAVKARVGSVDLGAHQDEIARVLQSARTPLEYAVPERPTPGMRRPSVAQKAPWNRRASPQAVVAAVRGDPAKGIPERDFQEVADEFGVKTERVRQIVKRHAPEIAAARAKKSREIAAQRRVAEHTAAKAAEEKAATAAAAEAKKAATKPRAKPARKADGAAKKPAAAPAAKRKPAPKKSPAKS